MGCASGQFQISCSTFVLSWSWSSCQIGYRLQSRRLPSHRRQDESRRPRKINPERVTLAAPKVFLLWESDSAWRPSFVFHPLRKSFSDLRMKVALAQDVPRSVGGVIDCQVHTRRSSWRWTIARRKYLPQHVLRPTRCSCRNARCFRKDCGAAGRGPSKAKGRGRVRVCNSL